MPSFFLVKSDPDTYSIEDFVKDEITTWDGVHNHQAIGYIKSWKVGDYVFIYHSQGQNTIVGLSRVVSEPIKDEHDPRGISWVADLKLLRVYPEEERITLKQIKATEKFRDFLLVRNGRLSVMPCPYEFVSWLAENGVDVSDPEV